VLPETLGLGFIIGLTGAVPPGPMLVAVINGALRHGWRAGPLAVVGHAAVELVIFVIIALGLAGAAAAHALTRPIGVVGGCVLIGFGALTLRGLRHDSPAVQVESSRHQALSAVSAGALSSISNPFFWLWWLTVGAMLVVSGLGYGLVGAALFVVGHWGADLSWYALVSVSLHKGRAIMSPRAMRLVIGACGTFMMGFGAWFLWGAASQGAA